MPARTYDPVSGRYPAPLHSERRCVVCGAAFHALGWRKQRQKTCGAVACVAAARYGRRRDTHDSK